MSPSERREMIRKENTDLSLTRQCKLLKISRSSIYYTPVGMNAETLKLMHEIDRVFTKYPFFGSRQIAAYLPQSGFSAGRHRVRRLMNIMGLQAIRCPAVYVLHAREGTRGRTPARSTHSTAFTLTC
jgi:putative transposase